MYTRIENDDDSVTLINETIGTYLVRQQKVAQKVVPHYFEKYKTEGVDYNIYIGNSSLEEENCCLIDIRYLCLWQPTTMCGIEGLMNERKPVLKTPLDTTFDTGTKYTP